MAPTRQLLPSAGPAPRWHWQHGPIDLIISAEGEATAVQAAHQRAWVRFQTVLQELVSELPLLRAQVLEHCELQGVVARRMWSACHPHRQSFITAMAAVAGAVADEIIAAYRVSGVRRAWVNNGGDIALHLAAGESVRVGVVADTTRVAIDGSFPINADSPIRGIATSGWRGRSFSLGIADSVTVLARGAAIADAAATVVANAVNVFHTGIQRQPANTLKDDSDLGELQVTTHVPPLPRMWIAEALRRGQACARRLQHQGLIDAAMLMCQGQSALVLPISSARAAAVHSQPLLAPMHEAA